MRLEQVTGRIGVVEQRLGHAVKQHRTQGVERIVIHLPGERQPIASTPLYPDDRVDVAGPNDVGGLAGPGRYRAGTGHGVHLPGTSCQLPGRIAGQQQRIQPALVLAGQ